MTSYYIEDNEQYVDEDYKMSWKEELWGLFVGALLAFIALC
jgi:hypothetical protein